MGKFSVPYCFREEFSEKFSKRCEKFGYHNWLADYENHIFPDEIQKETLSMLPTGFYKQDNLPDDLTKLDSFNLSGTAFVAYNVREYVIKIAGYALISNKTIKDLYKYLNENYDLKKIKMIEIMAGNALISAGLKDMNLDCIGTDIKDPEEGFDDILNWTDVEKIDCVEAIEKYKPDIVFCSWPRDNSPILEATNKIFEINPKAELIHIGENYGGCCASEEYWDYIMHNYKIEILDIHLDRWVGIHDVFTSIKKCN